MGSQLFGADQDGVHCDFCHKIQTPTLNEEGNPGGLSVHLLRPPAAGRVDNIFFGPWDDAQGETDVYNPAFSSSLICAPCHNHTEETGVLVYSEFSEWQNGPYAEKGIQCQDCHMQPTGDVTNIAPGNGGIERDPMTISSHRLLGINDSTFLASAVEMEMQSRVSETGLDVTVRLTNVGAGHFVPTGIPMRNMLLVLRAVNADGEALTLADGEILPDWAGSRRW